MHIKHQLLLFLALFLVERASAVVYYNQDVQIEKTHEENPDDETGESNSFLLQKENVLSTRDKSDHGKQMHFEDYQEQTMSLESDNEDNISNGSMNHLRHGVASKTENEISVGEPVYFDNVVSKRRPYAQNGKKGCEGVGAASGAWQDDQRWILIETTYKGGTAYYLSNNRSGRRLFYKKDNNKVCAFDGGFFDDQKWRLESEKKNGRIAYRIVHAMTGRRLFAKKGNNYQDGFGAFSGAKYDDQLWYEEL